MDAHLSRFLGAVKLALPYARLGAAEVRTSSTNERTTIDVLSPEGLIATTTIYTRPSSTRGPAQQLPLFATVESPAPPRPDAARTPEATPESAPVVDADELVELVAPPGWEPSLDAEVLDCNTALAWTEDSGGSFRTVLPGTVANRLLEQLNADSALPVPFTRRGPTAPSHLLRSGDEAMVGAIARRILGFVRGEDGGGSNGLVVEIDAVPSVAWLEGAVLLDDDTLAFHATYAYLCEGGTDGFWRAVRIDSLRPTKGAKKAPKTAASKPVAKTSKSPKASKPAPAPVPTVSRWVLESDWQAMPEAKRAHLFVGANHRAAGSSYRELGPMPLPVAIDLDADAKGVVPLLSERPAEGASADPAFFLASYPVPHFDGHHDEYQPVADELGMCAIDEAAGQMGAWVVWHAEGNVDRTAVTVVRAELVPRLRAMAEAAGVALAVEPDLEEAARPRRGDSVLRVGSVVHHDGDAWLVTMLSGLTTLRRRSGEGVTTVRTMSIRPRTDASGEFDVRQVARPVPATAPAKRKPAPGSSSKKTPHRLTAIPEADALAEHGKLVAVALQPDGHWKVWATNPAPETGLLLTSPAWKTRWSRARANDLRVRLYNRARRCTHDSLDGDIGAENDAAA